MEKKQKNISGIELPAVAARLVGLRQQTVHAAIARGDIPTETLEGGTVVVRLDALRHYAAHRPKRGPKAKSESGRG